MSDPRQFNYTVSNKGNQVNINTHFESAYTDEICDDSGNKTPVKITDFILTGTIKKSDGTVLVSLIETLDDTQTGLFRIDSANGEFKLIIDATTSALMTDDDLGTYDIVFTDALLKKRIFMRGKIEFILTASS